MDKRISSIIKRAGKFSSCDAAQRWAATLGQRWVVRGDVGQFWVVRPVDANRLHKAGYELA